ncbi:hypothetical protein PanWU01x14_215610 [Parasponia andersonii]|uniref:Transmembrane protein n=1 Tax=Parasponia andersonii TaxID=3476 RepID=A0A2P5BRP3_PARAD|nr:hypothetical protein PanWU01x14_215610 [Parasponia andersonii]
MAAITIFFLLLDFILLIARAAAANPPPLPLPHGTLVVRISLRRVRRTRAGPNPAGLLRRRRRGVGGFVRALVELHHELELLLPPPLVLVVLVLVVVHLALLVLVQVIVVVYVVPHIPAPVTPPEVRFRRCRRLAG